MSSTRLLFDHAAADGVAAKQRSSYAVTNDANVVEASALRAATGQRSSDRKRRGDVLFRDDCAGGPSQDGESQLSEDLPVGSYPAPRAQEPSAASVGVTSTSASLASSFARRRRIR